jgi:hypothetical protein
MDDFPLINIKDELKENIKQFIQFHLEVVKFNQFCFFLDLRF